MCVCVAGTCIPWQGMLLDHVESLASHTPPASMVLLLVVVVVIVAVVAVVQGGGCDRRGSWLGLI